MRMIDLGVITLVTPDGPTAANAVDPPPYPLTSPQCHRHRNAFASQPNKTPGQIQTRRRPTPCILARLSSCSDERLCLKAPAAGGRQAAQPAPARDGGTFKAAAA